MPDADQPPTVPPRPPFPKGRQLDEDASGAVDALLEGLPRERSLLIEYLHRIQDGLGHIPVDHLAALAHALKLSQAEVYEVATFYAHFQVAGEGITPPPLTVRVCGGIACEMAGGGELLGALKKALGDRVQILAAPCVGACDRAPVAKVGTREIGRAAPDSVSRAIDGGETAQPAPVPSGDGTFEIYRQCQAGERTRETVMAEVDRAGLRGMGGAGFPVTKKWRFVLEAPKPRVLVVNADEGEPGTFKDRHCLETNPRRVLEGALIAAWAVDADDIYIYLRDEYAGIRALLEQEVAALEDSGIAGDTRLHLRRGAGAYICGEETALLESIEGKRGLPRNRPPYPAHVGLFGRPTLINNVETLYWLPEILDKGAEWYQGQGRPHFYSVSGRVKNPGVKLAPSGVTLETLVDKHCGGMADGHALKGYLPGGASGGILPASMSNVPLDFGTLEKYGCFIGSAAIVVLSDKDDIKSVVKNLIAFFAEESCGQCTPCRAGCEKLEHLLSNSRLDQPLFEDLAAAMRDASICGLGQAAPNPVACAFKYFGDEMT